MPSRIPRSCRKLGCRHTTTARHGYCDVHKGLASNWNAYHKGKNRHQRGYGAAWDKLRKHVLERDKYLCQQCLKKGIATEATDVDHIQPKSRGGGDEWTNLQALCSKCHRLKTVRDRLG